MKQRKKRNDKEEQKTKRFLIVVSVLGSAGPLKFVANEDDLVAGVINAALKLYAREGRLPPLGSDPDNFLLYSANAGADALNAWEKIGSSGGRNFVMCRKAGFPNMTEARNEMMNSNKGNGSWKAWINRSLSFKALSH
ncbi:hypothetical protein Nepgr_022201 [Nepenthes gracilis]|uniref:DUF7054 domain-containing protein n=1 Tax=Nepenthes gracilis TaxID=150966 RepID=A0AAD3SZ45_NEPGR|nr:hypothetical protein Nepgr_022201 [Nepenthes gracilis]